MRKVYYIKQTPAGRVFDAVNGIVIALLMFLMIYPFWNMLILSFNDGTDALLGKLYFWPRVWTLANYEYVFKNRDLLHGALVSVLRVVVGTVTGVICNALLGYIVSCRQFYGRKFMRVLFIITMYFGGGLIPTYLTIRALGLLGSFWALILPGAVSAYNMILLLNFFKTIPSELEEAALIDGAGHWRILWGLYVPCSLPAIATLTLFFVVGHWNEWFSAQIYLNRTEQYPLQSYLQVLLTQSKNTQNLSLKELEELAKVNNRTFNSAQIVLSTLPVLLVYPFLQRYFVTGLTLGSVKG